MYYLLLIVSLGNIQYTTFTTGYETAQDCHYALTLQRDSVADYDYIKARCGVTK